MQAARWEGPTVEAEGKARAKRTSNIHHASMTLDVSQLSGWLNADAHCRVEMEAYEERRHAGWKGVQAAAAQAACKKGPGCGGGR